MEEDKTKTMCACSGPISPEAQAKIEQEWKDAGICNECVYESRNGHSFECSQFVMRLPPMGVSQWMEHGRQYAYDKYFEEQIRADERKKAWEEIQKFDFKEEHFCPLNDGEQNCACMINTLQVVKRILLTVSKSAPLNTKE